jgi:hypothetical protein
MQGLKTFKDLKFEDCHAGGEKAYYNFDDGSSIIVFRNVPTFYCEGDKCEVLSDRYKNAKEGRLQTPEQITEHMIYIQQNPKTDGNTTKDI